MRLPVILLHLTPWALLQAQSETPAVFTEAQEIRLARSGAPNEVSRDATILVLRQGRYAETVKGTNSVTCLVNRSQPLSLEPECYDGEASTSILPIQLFQTEQRLAGRTRPDIDAEIAAGLQSGRFRLPRRPALVYMLSADQVLYTEDGGRVGAWLPHLMWYYPYLKAGDFGMPAANATLSFLGEGTALSAVVVPVRTAMQPEPASP